MVLSVYGFKSDSYESDVIFKSIQSSDFDFICTHVKQA